jgi:hypothetical protein
MLNYAQAPALSGAQTHPATGTATPCAYECGGQPGLSAREPTSVVDWAPGAEGQAIFNPFSNVGTVVRISPSLPPEPQGGDWTLSLLAVLVGIVLIAWMLRKMVQ